MKFTFKNADVREEFQKLINDETFTVKQFGFKRSYLVKMLTRNRLIQNETMLRLLNVYNEYYQTSLCSTDLFDMHEITKRTTSDTEFRFGDDTSQQIAFRFIEKILSIRGLSGAELISL